MIYVLEIIKFFFSVRGTLSRFPYVLCLFCLWGTMGGVIYFTYCHLFAYPLNIVAMVLFVASMISDLCIKVRRLHDTGNSGFWVLGFVISWLVSEKDGMLEIIYFIYLISINIYTIFMPSSIEEGAYLDTK